MSDLRQKINDDVKAAMRSRDKPRLLALRLITAAIKQQEIDKRITIDDAVVLAVLGKMAKQARNAIQQFADAGRTDLVEKESLELSIIEAYLPTQLSDSEIEQIITEAVVALEAKSIKDMSRVMGTIKPRVQDRADMAKVSVLVKQQLAAIKHTD